MEQAKYMRKPFVLVSEITKKVCSRWMEGVKICIFVSVCYNSFSASRLHDLKTL